MLISRDKGIENVDVYLNKDAPETASNKVGLPASIPWRWLLFYKMQTQFNFAHFLPTLTVMIFMTPNLALNLT